jgi:hypothetical protein
VQSDIASGAEADQGAKLCVIINLPIESIHPLIARIIIIKSTALLGFTL